MASQDDVYALTGSRVSVGASSHVGITSVAGLIATTIKLISGSCAIVAGPSLSHVTGYPLSTTEAVAVSGPAKFYLAADTDSVVAVLKGLSAGNEF